MFAFIFAIFMVALFAVPAIYLLIRGGKTFTNDPTKTIDNGPYIPRRIVGAALLGVFLVYAIFSCTAIVQPRHEGVRVTLGKASTDTVSSGPLLKWPWQKIVSVDMTKQVDNWNGGKAETDHSVIKVLLGNGNQTDAYASVTWGVKDGSAHNAYTEYRGDDPLENIYERVIAPKIKSSLQEVSGLYNPNEQILAVLAAQKSGKVDVSALGQVRIAPDLDELTHAVKADFLKRVAVYDVVEIYDVNVSFIQFDEATRGTITDFQAEVQKTINALQGVQTAEQIAKQNKLLAASVREDPEALAAQCFKMISEGKFNPPIGFSCYPDSGGRAPVIVDSRR